MSGYIGTTPVPQATQHRESFTANANQTTFATAGYTVGYIDVWVNGVKLAAGDMTVTNGSDIVLASAAAANDIIEYVAFVPFNAANQTFTGATVINSLNVNSDGATVTGIKDEDNMASNSANKLATQQSIKAYVDAQQNTVDTLGEILALSNTTGGTDISVSTDDKVQFRDSAIYINSSADGQLDIVADTEIQIAATTVDINGAINASGEIIAASLDISGNIDVDGVTNLDVVDIDGAVDMASTLGVTGVVTANAGVVVDNFTLDGTTLALSSGSMTLDSASQIILDAAGGNFQFSKSGTEFARIFESGSDFYIYNPISDKDIKFYGNDGGTSFTALTLDMSAAGAATFNAGVTAPQLAITSASTADTATFTRGTNGQNNIFKFVTGSTADWIVGERNDSTSDFRFYSYGTSSNVLSIARATGNVGIGTSSPSAKLHIKGGSDMGIRIESDNDGYANLQFGDADDLVRGSISYNNADDSLQLRGYNNTERMRIDSSGNVLVGKTSVDSGVVGVEAKANGTLTATVAGDTVSLLNRKSNDGEILRLQKDGTAIGSIGAFSSSNFGITGSAANKGGLIFATSEVLPAKNGTYSSSTVDLGNSGTLFKDLYLSGGVYLGGTGAANKLDDYEEGTWTPAITGASSAPTITYLNNGGTYTKIGNTVTLFFGTRIDGISGGSGVVRITGLPFAAGSYGAFQNPAGVATAQVLTTSQEGPVLFYAEDNAATLQGRLLNDNADTIMNLNLLQGGSYIVCTFTYQL